MEKIISFEDFLNRASELAEESDAMAHEGHEEKGSQHYMFFQNLASIKHYVDEILTMDPEKVDSMLKDGHDWASDHISTSKDDVQEVAEWLRNAMEGHGSTSEEPETMIVNVEGNDDQVEVESGEEKEGEEEEEDEDEE
jgi:hypothetical protein